MKGAHAELHTEPFSYRDQHSHSSGTQRKILPSVDWNHPVIICDINVSAIFSITVTKDYYSQLSSVLWIGELTKMLILAATNIADCDLVEQQEGWFMGVILSVGYVCYSRRWRSCKEFFRGAQNGIKCEGSERKIKEFITHLNVSNLHHII
jgi:hypothetical protein